MRDHLELVTLDEFNLERIRVHDVLIFVSDGKSRDPAVALVRAVDDGGPEGVDVKVLQIIQQGKMTLAEDQVFFAKPHQLIKVESNPIDPKEPERLELYLEKSALSRVPKPAKLAVLLLSELGYPFIGTKEEYLGADLQVPIYNAPSQIIGFISYIRQEDGQVKVIISDVPNSQGNILTAAARMQIGR